MGNAASYIVDRRERVRVRVGMCLLQIQYPTSSNARISQTGRLSFYPNQISNLSHMMRGNQWLLVPFVKSGCQRCLANEMVAHHGTERGYVIEVRLALLNKRKLRNSHTRERVSSWEIMRKLMVYTGRVIHCKSDRIRTKSSNPLHPPYLVGHLVKTK